MKNIKYSPIYTGLLIYISKPTVIVFVVINNMRTIRIILFYSPQPVIDLQLPDQEFIEIKMPSVKEKEHTFKEKVVGSVGPLTKKESTEAISFKKSKFKKSNSRKRLDDD